MADVDVTAGITAAQIAGESAEMDVVAEELAARAKAEAQKHRDGGAFSSSIIVMKARGKRGVTDRLVAATDPLAVPKELGHVIKNEAGGPVLGYVKGQHSMGKAVASMPVVSGG
ncbi:DUF5403 family protein [Humibacter sp. RRB41]|uniref:DUF5403 family protein n=1 Tax=Humibacter sp. RRB41 TaxID=2919946 RepID=UPI001FAA24F4|nr:DUF5403 family protein [Humibacter sp. RRB41]